jgi:hypothetical protein
MKRLVLFMILVVSLLTTAYPQQIRYVKPVSSGLADGSSWANASNDLQLMINNSNAGDTIWVAEGTYLPIRRPNALHIITPNNVDNAFLLKSDVHIYGGFPNTGTATWIDRDWDVYPAILSGDIGIVDDTTDNCYSVVMAVGDVGTACLDGFTITKGGIASPVYANITINGILVGFACVGFYIVDASPVISNLTVTNNFGDGIIISNGSPILNHLTITNNFGTGISIWNSSSVLDNITVSNNFGGGIYIDSYVGNTSVILTNITVSNNFRIGIGISSHISGNTSAMLTNVAISNNQWGGLSNYGSSTILTNAIISKNTSGAGGGIDNSNSSLVLTNVTIAENETIGNIDGGGIYNKNSSLVLTDVLIANNTAAAFGGGICNIGSSSILTNVIISGNTAIAGGGIYNEDHSSTILSNVLIADNKAKYGGGIYSPSRYSGFDSLLMTNVTICNNRASDKYGGIYRTDSSFYFIHNSIIWGNTDSINNMENNISNSIDNITFENSLVGGEPLVNGIILNTDPLFEDTANGDYRLSYCSPAIDAGSNAFYSPDSLPDLSAITMDLDSNPRIYNGIIDLGAYEFQQNRILDTLTFSADTIICPEEVAKINLAFKGGFPWNLIYTTDYGENYDTIHSISTASFSWEVIPDTTYKFWAERICPTPINSVRIRELPRLVFTNSFSNDTLCSGEYTTPVAFSGNVTNFEWTANGNVIDSMPAGVQTGDFGAYLVENKGNTALTSIITVKPNSTASMETCGKTDTTFSITVLPEPKLTTILKNDTLCSGNQTTPVIFSGATSYQWLASENVLGIPTGTQTGNFGNYTVENKSESNQQSTVRVTPLSNLGNKICLGDIGSFQVLVYPQTQIQSFTSNKPVFCEGEQLELYVEATGGDLSYKWYLNNNLLANTSNKQYSLFLPSRSYSGNYHVEVSGRCGTEKSQNIYREVSSDKMLVEKWDDVILVDNSMNDYVGYQWYKDNQLIPGATNQFYQELSGLNGCYGVELTLVNGRKMRSCERCIEQPDRKAFSIYPNPVKQGQNIWIETTEEIHYIRVYSVDGKLLHNKQYPNGNVSLDLPQLPAGMYLINALTQEGKSYNTKLIVAK